MTVIGPQSPGHALAVAASDPAAARDEMLRATAVELEATFLAEMLKAAKFGEPRRAFGGGAGEEQFSSFMRLEVARDMARSGGLGLAQHIFEALKERENGNPG